MGKNTFSKTSSVSLMQPSGISFINTSPDFLEFPPVTLAFFKKLAVTLIMASSKKRDEMSGEGKENACFVLKFILCLITLQPVRSSFEYPMQFLDANLNLSLFFLFISFLAVGLVNA